MNKTLRSYWEFLRPWLTVAVYLWLLELIADFSIVDPEPLLDRLADWSAILWTLVFWIALALLGVWLIAQIFNRNFLLVLSNRGANAVFISVTAIYFIRWLFVWAVWVGDSDAIVYGLLAVGFLLGGWAWLRRKNRRRDSDEALPLRRDAHDMALLVLTVSALILATELTDHLLQARANRLALGRSGTLSLRSDTNAPPPNVVVIVADSLRAQNMSLFGYGRNTTRFLSRFAGSSTVFTHMYTNSTTTRVSMTTLLSGKHPFSHGRLTRLLPPYRSPENLVALLRAHGYTTAAVTSNLDGSFNSLGLEKYLLYGQYTNFSPLTLSWLREMGVYPTLPGNRMYGELSRFLPFLGFPEKTRLYGSADESLKLAAGLIRDLAQPFFLLVHLHEPHSPYETPPPFRGKYAKIDYHELEQKLSSDDSARYPAELQPFVDAYRDHYDEAIEFLDSQLEKFIQELADNPKFRNSILIITGDHGESFERGYFIHGEDLYESSVHVPLIIRYPNQDRGRRLTVPVQSIDIAPTILNEIGIPIPGWMDGRPAPSDANSEPREAIMINYKEPSNGRFYTHPTKLAIRHDRYKLIASCDTKRLELYDLANDPGEKTDLAKTEPTLVKDLWRRLARHLANQKGDHKLECAMGFGA